MIATAAAGTDYTAVLVALVASGSTLTAGFGAQLAAAWLQNRREGESRRRSRYEVLLYAAEEIRSVVVGRQYGWAGEDREERRQRDAELLARAIRELDVATSALSLDSRADSVTGAARDLRDRSHVALLAFNTIESGERADDLPESVRNVSEAFDRLRQNMRTSP